MRKETLIDLLAAESSKASALLLMQVGIENEDFEMAIGYQFEYLYWCDEVTRLRGKFSGQRLNLVLLAHGG